MRKVCTERTCLLVFLIFWSRINSNNWNRDGNQCVSRRSESSLFLFFFFFWKKNQRRIDAIGRVAGRGVTEANYKGRITGSWATKQPSLFWFWLSRAIHVVRELFVLRRIGNIIIGVIASQKPKPHLKGVTCDQLGCELTRTGRTCTRDVLIRLIENSLGPRNYFNHFKQFHPSHRLIDLVISPCSVFRTFPKCNQDTRDKRATGKGMSKVHQPRAMLNHWLEEKRRNNFPWNKTYNLDRKFAFSKFTGRIEKSETVKLAREFPFSQNENFNRSGLIPRSFIVSERTHFARLIIELIQRVQCSKQTLHTARFRNSSIRRNHVPATFVREDARTQGNGSLSRAGECRSDEMWKEL